MKIFNLYAKDKDNVLMDKILVQTTDYERDLVNKGNFDKLLEDTPYTKDDIFLYADTEEVFSNGTFDNIALSGIKFNEYDRELIFDTEDEMER